MHAAHVSLSLSTFEDKLLEATTLLPGYFEIYVDFALGVCSNL